MLGALIEQAGYELRQSRLLLRISSGAAFDGDENRDDRHLVMLDSEHLKSIGQSSLDDGRQIHFRRRHRRRRRLLADKLTQLGARSGESVLRTPRVGLR